MQNSSEVFDRIFACTLYFQRVALIEVISQIEVEEIASLSPQKSKKKTMFQRHRHDECMFFIAFNFYTKCKYN